MVLSALSVVQWNAEIDIILSVPFSTVVVIDSVRTQFNVTELRLEVVRHPGRPSRGDRDRQHATFRISET
jgi:hypothetical protein